jgi:hypothetical protein
VGGTVRAIGPVFVVGDLDITGTGVFDLGTTQTVVVAGAITTGSSAVLVDTGGSVIAVDGNALFGGGSEAGKLTNGSLQLTGSFTQNGDPESYATQTGFFTIFMGSIAQQTVSFANPGTGAGFSHFAGLQVFDTVGVSLQSAAFVDGPFIAAAVSTVPPLLLGNGNALTVQGITLDSVIIDNMPLVVTNSPQGLFALDVVFRNFSPSAIQFDITRTSAVAVTFTNLRFQGTPPSPGFHLRANGPSSGGPFTVTLVTPTPSAATGAARFTTTGQAVINWP